VRRVAAEVAHGAQNVNPQPVVLLDTRLPPERDELAAHAVDQGQGARQLERALPDAGRHFRTPSNVIKQPARPS
jgi:hypothetical protein